MSNSVKTKYCAWFTCGSITTRVSETLENIPPYTEDFPLIKLSNFD